MKLLLTTVAASVLIGGIAYACYETSAPKCDSAEAITTIKNMALEKINDDIKGYFVPGRIFVDYRARDYSIENLMIDSFRRRGAVGKTGSSCAAQINVTGGKYGTDVFSAEYMIEPTTDGKTMVSARFIPRPR